jgi:hypothetical protein
MGNDQIILKGIIEEQRKTSAPDMEFNDFFEIFAPTELLKDYDLSYEEIESGVVDGGGDGGIDSAYVFLNGDLLLEDSEIEVKKRNEIELFVFQTKTAESFGETPLDKLTASASDLFDLQANFKELEKTYNKELLSIFKRFSDTVLMSLQAVPKISITYKYISLGEEIHPNVARKADILKSNLLKSFTGAEVDIEFVGANKLLDEVRRAPKTTFTLDFSDSPITTDDGSYIFLASLPSYYEFMVTDSNKLVKKIFESNVRDYQGNVKVNEAIYDSLSIGTQEDFWCLNNGVTILTTSATTVGKKLQLEDPQVVNGMQTSFEIYRHFSKGDKKDDVRKILIRVITQKDAESRDRIVRATNSQTSIPEASLRGADKVQRDIEDYFGKNGYFYDRRKNYYKNQGKEKSKIVGIPLLAQAVMATLLQKPDFARARPSTLIKEQKDYEEIFNDKYPIQMYLNAFIILKKAEGVVKSKAQSLGFARKDITNLKFFVAMSASCLACEKVAGITVSDIGALKVTDIDDKLFEDAFNIANNIFQAEGATDKVAKSKDFRNKVLSDLESNVATKPET